MQKHAAQHIQLGFQGKGRGGELDWHHRDARENFEQLLFREAGLPEEDQHIEGNQPPREQWRTADRVNVIEWDHKNCLFVAR